MLTQEELRLIRNSWVAIARHDEHGGAVFYRNLFRRMPEVRPLFANDLSKQEEKLIETLAVVVDLLEAPDELTRTATDLGRRHTDYGVKQQHYAQTGAALLDTIQECGGSAITPEVLRAWQKAFDLVSSVMQTADRRAAPRALSERARGL